MNSRLGVYGSLKHDCEPAVPIGRVYFVCIVLVLYADCMFERKRRGWLKPDCLQTMLTLTVILLLQYMFCNELCVLCIIYKTTGVTISDVHIVTNLEFLFTLYKVKTRPNPMKGGVTMCRRAPRA